MVSRILILTSALSCIATAGVSPATGLPSQGKLIGMFTITGGMCGRGSCEYAMSGVATLTGADGHVHRINVGTAHPLDVRLKKARFSVSLAPGTYRIKDRLGASAEVAAVACS